MYLTVCIPLSLLNLAAGMALIVSIPLGICVVFVALYDNAEATQPLLDALAQVLLRAYPTFGILLLGFCFYEFATQHR